METRKLIVRLYHSGYAELFLDNDTLPGSDIATCFREGEKMANEIAKRWNEYDALNKEHWEQVHKITELTAKLNDVVLAKTTYQREAEKKMRDDVSLILQLRYDIGVLQKQNRKPSLKRLWNYLINNNK